MVSLVTSDMLHVMCDMLNVICDMLRKSFGETRDHELCSCCVFILHDPYMPPTILLVPSRVQYNIMYNGAVVQ